MKILYIAALPPPVTGQSLACQVLLEDLVRTDQVEVVNLSKDGFKQGIQSVERVLEIVKVWLSVLRRKGSADLIYFTISESLFGNLKDLVLYLICFRQLPRMVIHLHGGAGFVNIMNGGTWLSALNRFMIRRLGGAIVLGERHVGIFSGCLPKERIHVVPNFSQDYLFLEPPQIAAKFAQAAPLRLLFLSNLIPGKGHGELLDAFLSLAPERRRRFALDFAGGFESEQDRVAFQERIAGLEQVTYHGVVHGDRKKELFARAHLFCLPTYYPYEGQPISILEAYASGCAVITTDHSGIFDVFQDGENGFAVEKRSPADLARVLGQIADQAEGLRAIALRNNETANRLYRVPVYLANLRGAVLACDPAGGPRPEGVGG